MASDDHIRNPIEWGRDQLLGARSAVSSGAHAVRGDDEARIAPPQVRKIDIGDLRDALRSGLADFGAYRTDVIFLCAIYPVAGLILAALASGYGLLPLVFPLASGFALLGPFAGMGLYEMSRRREADQAVGWADAFAVLRSPVIGAILMLGLVLLVIFAAWLGAASLIYDATLGPAPPESLGGFLEAVFTTGAGWAMILVGCGVGFLFAVLAMAISVVSFPMLIDRDVGLFTAIATSVRAVAANPRPMAAWGLLVVAGLVLGSIPALVGLAIVLPVLGHATWHLYRKLID